MNCTFFIDETVTVYDLTEFDYQICGFGKDEFRVTGHPNSAGHALCSTHYYFQ